MGVKEFKNGQEIIHKGHKGATTACGFDTSENLSYWVNTREAVTCDKQECKN